MKYWLILIIIHYYICLLLMTRIIIDILYQDFLDKEHRQIEYATYKDLLLKIKFIWGPDD